MTDDELKTELLKTLTEEEIDYIETEIALLLTALQQVPQRVRKDAFTAAQLVIAKWVLLR